MHIWDSGNIIADIGTETVYYIRVLTLIYAKNGETKTYYRFNGHGDVIALANSSGAIIKRYKYDSFGVEENPGIFDTNVFRYCGEYYDVETKTIYLRARYYDAETGRFTQQDGWSYAVPGFLLSLNLYTYCWNNPIGYVDVDGHAATRILLRTLWGAAKGMFGGYLKARIHGGEKYAQYMVIGTITGALDGFIKSFAPTPTLSRVLSIVSGGICSMIDSSITQLWENGSIDISQVLYSGVQGVISEVLAYAINEKVAKNIIKGIISMEEWLANISERFLLDLGDIQLNDLFDEIVETLLAKLPFDIAMEEIEKEK